MNPELWNPFCWFFGHKFDIPSDIWGNRHIYKPITCRRCRWQPYTEEFLWGEPIGTRGDTG